MFASVMDHLRWSWIIVDNWISTSVIYIYIYIYIWRILWSSYECWLTLVGFEPATTEYRLNTDSLTNWAMRPWVQLVLRANFVKLLQFHRLFSNASCYHSLIFIRKNLGKFFQEQESDWSGVFLQIEKM